MTIQPAPTMHRIARCYGISREYHSRLTALLGATLEDWLEPDLIFRKLLDRSHSPLRRKLADPTARAAIKKSLRKTTQ